jgi:hypothetical protein
MSTLPFTIPPAIPLFVAALVNVTRFRSRYAVSTVIVIDISLALLLQHLLPKPSIAPFWGPLTSVLSQWYRIIPSQHREQGAGRLGLLQSYTQGPLGPGASKVVQVLVAIALWRWRRGEWPHISLGPPPTPLAWLTLLVVSLAVNLVLFLWSRTTKSRGQHVGVQRMVRSTSGRSLNFTERCHFATLALINGTCEEITSRWFWWQEFQVYYPHPLRIMRGDGPYSASSFLSIPNLAQATIFGVWHYYGIPSGLTGVALTFVYGWLMGVLMIEVGEGGLCLPIIAHAIADNYIFSTVARGKALGR